MPPREHVNRLRLSVHKSKLLRRDLLIEKQCLLVDSPGSMSAFGKVSQYQLHHQDLYQLLVLTEPPSM